MQLNEFQEKFTDLMLGHPAALDQPPAALAALFHHPEDKLPARLKIYRNNIVGSLCDVMLASFPVIGKLTGEEFLTGMTRSFILQNPPQAGCLNTYGRGFPEFIEGFEPAKPLPYLADIARMEIALNDSYYAKDHTALSPDELATVPPEKLSDLNLRVNEHIHILRSDYPLQAIREFCLSENQDETLNIDQGGGHWLIYRAQLNSHLEPITAAEYACLKALIDGASLGEAVQSALDDQQDFDFQSFLQKHLSLETFSLLDTNR